MCAHATVKMPVMMERRSLLLCALAAPAALPFIRHARAADLPRFELGIASGTPQPHSVVLWTRLSGLNLAPKVDVQWELAHDEAFTRIAARGVEVALQDEAHSVHVEPRNLEPARSYWYRFTALGQQSGVGHTRTSPAPDAVVNELRFAIASCQRWDHGQWAAWRHMANDPPELMLFLGDYIYEAATSPAAAGSPRAHRGGPVRTLAGYRDRYAQYKSDPALQAAHAACPWLMVWDDHEVENDYAGLQGQRLQLDFERQRAEAYQAYWEHMPLPRAVKPLTHHMSMHSRLDWGRLARIHLLDDRQYRSPQACPKPFRGGSNIVRASDCTELQDPQRTMLGAAQEAWLAEGWSLDRPWNLLAQQTLMAPYSRSSLGTLAHRDGSYWTDGWDGYPAARERLLRTVAQRQVPGTVVLGGDVHANFVADLRVNARDERTPIVASEFCGTSISSHGAKQSTTDKYRAFNPHLHYARSDERGTQRFVLRPQQLQAAIHAVDEPMDAQSAEHISAKFTVAAARPGVQPG